MEEQHDLILDKMMKLEADGVVFMDFDDYFLSGEYEKCKEIVSYTKSEWSKKNKIYPKAPYVFYKNINGKKVYCE